MKNKISAFLTLLLATIILCSCSNSSKKPNEDQIKAICELSTLECYYNNVAKSTKEKGQGFSHLFEKDREFWIEYEGVAKIGIDMNEVAMEINENTVTITMPPAKLISIGIVTETLNEDSYILSKDGWNSNIITAEEQQRAISVAQDEMRENVLQNQALFDRAENEARSLIENYINQLGEISGKNYSIAWNSL